MPIFGSAAEPAPNAIVGAARRVNLHRRDEVETLRERGTAEWQKYAWRYYDSLGEVKFALNYFANVASRVRLHVGFQDDSSDTPVDIGQVSAGVSRNFTLAARHELDKLNHGRGGQPNLIRSSVLNLLVAGEYYLVGSHDSWNVRSTSELQFEDGNRVRLVLSRSERSAHRQYLPESAFVARVWRTHPQYSDDADSSLKGVINDCGELLLLSRLIRASAQSRLNAGLLYVADELRFQRSTDVSSDAVNPDVDPLEEELTLALTEPIGISDSPSEVVPLLIRGPADLIDKGVKHVDLSRGFDETIVKRHDQTLQRVMNGLDLPKDIITGLANVRYSNAREITQDMYKAHVEPMILLICEALTTAYLRPRLEARGYPSELIAKTCVWYDPSEVVVKPDRSEDADKGYGQMLVSGDTWRRAHGFSKTDAPSEEETVKRVAMAGAVAPSTTLDFMRQIAPKLVAEAERLARESFGAPDKSATSDSAKDTPGAAGGTPTDTSASGSGNSGGAATRPTNPGDRSATWRNVDSRSGESSPPEGELPPRADAAQLMEVLKSLTAATQPSGVVQERNRKLEQALEVERRLRESLHVHLNDVVFRALERAGARTVSKIRGDAELKSLVSEVPIVEAFAQVPEDRLDAFALEPRRLLRDTIERARSTYTDHVASAQRQGWKALGDNVFEARTPTQKADLDRSWTWLVERLVELAVGWLRKPREKETRGTYVDMDTVRTATALAGGDEEPTATNNGRAVLSTVTIDATGWEFSDRYRWVYGVSENSFHPHVVLDNTVFETWEAGELAHEGGADTWPYVTHYYPGDHNGCRCDWLPEVLDPAQVNAPERGQTWPEYEAPVAASAHVNGSGGGDG